MPVPHWQPVSSSHHGFSGWLSHTQPMWLTSTRPLMFIALVAVMVGVSLMLLLA
jgi:hypothetical protein